MGFLFEWIKKLREWLSVQGFTSGESDQIIGGLIVGVILAIGGSIFIAWRLGGWSVIVWLAKKITGEKSEPSQPKQALNPNIPPDAIEFVSRSDDKGRNLLELLSKNLQPQNNKFVALWGEGGVGKTTLAKESARSLISIYGNRIIFSSAEGKDDLYTFSTLLEDVIKHFQREDILQLTLQLKIDTIQQVIAESPTLIILDNFETISYEEQQKCADFLLNKLPFPALITTRDVHEIPQAFPIKIEAMTPEESEQFLQQIISPYDENIFTPEIIHRIMQEAKRIPLVMGWLVEQIRQARRVETVFADLKKGKGSAAERIFARSFRLPQLGNDGRMTLLALSIFSPSASREALSRVAGFENDETRLDESLHRLMDLRLIKASDNNNRFSVQGLTRELAQNHLIDSNSTAQKKNVFLARWINWLFSRKSVFEFQASEFHKRFVNYFLSYIKKNKMQTAKCYDDLEFEKDNLVMSINLAFDSKNWTDFFYLASILAHCSNGMLSVRGYWSEAIFYCEKALNAARNLIRQEEIAFFTHSLAVSYRNIGNTEKVEEFYLESLEIRKQLNELNQVARILNDLAAFSVGQGDYEKARQLYTESIEIKEKLNDKKTLAGSYMNFGILEMNEGNFGEAKKLLTKSLNISETLENRLESANVYLCFGSLAIIQKNYEEAERFLFDSLNIYEHYRHQSKIALALHNIGRLRLIQNRQNEAIDYMKKSFLIYEKLGSFRAKAISELLYELENENE